MIDESELLVGVQNGTPDFDAIFHAYGKTMSSYVHKFLGSDLCDTAEVVDVVQEACLKVWKGGMLTPDTRSIKAKLFTVLHGCAVDHQRRQGRRPDRVPLDTASGRLPEDLSIEKVDDRLRDAQALTAVQAERHRLDATQATVFEARLRGASFAEIGAANAKSGEWARKVFTKAVRIVSVNVQVEERE